MHVRPLSGMLGDVRVPRSDLWLAGSRRVPQILVNWNTHQGTTFINESLITKTARKGSLAGVTARIANTYLGSSKRATRTDTHQKFPGAAKIRAVVAEGSTQLIGCDPVFSLVAILENSVAYQKSLIIDTSPSGPDVATWRHLAHGGKTLQSLSRLPSDFSCLHL